MAAQMTTAWLAVDQMSVMPKKIGRLLAKMLSVEPAERPGDPLAFYRQLQDCLTDLTRRETTTRPAAVPIARTIAIDLAKKRRSPLKTLARAALVLALAAMSALGWREYLRHRRVVEAEEPIGVSIGVAEVSASATPVIATAPDTMVSIVRQPTPVAVNANTTQSVPATNAEPDNNAPPVPEPTPVTANNLSTLPAAINSSRIVSTRETETMPAPSTEAEANPVDQPAAPKKTIMHEVRRAQPADEAQPERSPPGEGPAAVTSAPTPGPKSNAVKPREQSREVAAEATETTSLVLKRTDSAPEVAPKSPAGKTERPARPKRQVDQKIYLLPGREFEAPPTERLPRGSVRGRFMGVTADGKWKFELPSHEIVIVPAPPSPP
jgi:hypothetical protein